MPRYAQTITKTDLMNNLVSRFSKMLVREEVCDQEDIDEWDMETIITYGIREDSTIHSDLKKIDFNRENLTITPDIYFEGFNARQAEEWLGIHEWDGLTVLGCLGGGDWEHPTAFVVYFDGKKFRGYVPTNGNSFDLASKAAIGSAPKGAVARPFDVAAMRRDVTARITVKDSV